MDCQRLVAESSEVTISGTDGHCQCNLLEELRIAGATGADTDACRGGQPISRASSTISDSVEKNVLKPAHNAFDHL